jgi:hypothetical protein
MMRLRADDDEDDGDEDIDKVYNSLTKSKSSPFVAPSK